VTTVLIADDDADHREIMTLALRRLGHQVVVAENGAQVLAAAARGGIDAALLDGRMPDMSGIELCRLLRDAPATAQLPIMVVSADAHGTQITAAMDAGADDYLTKPYHRSDLGAQLDALLLRRDRSGTRPAAAANAALLAARAAMPKPAAVPALPILHPLRRTA
jgi:DNA-binding response OmpR family regulator